MKKLLLLAVISSACLMANGQKKVTLKYDLKEGSTYQMKQVTEQSIKQEVQGMSMDIKIAITANTSYVVNKALPGKYEIDVIYNDLSMNMESPMMNMKFDSKDTADANNPAKIALATIVGQRFNMVMDDKGKVLSVTGFAKILDSLNVKTNGNAEMANQMAETLKQNFSDEAMKGSMEMVMSVFPDQPVSVGDTWVVKTVTSGGMQLSNENTLTLKDAKDGQWVLTGSSKITSNLDKPMEANGMKMMFDLTGTSTYEMTLSAATGWVANSSISQTINGDMSIEGGQLPSPMEIPMKIDQKTTISGI